MSTRTRLQKARWSAVVALVGCLTTFAADAHEVLVRPERRADGSRTIRPWVVGGAHLGPTPAVLDFGDVLVGTSATRTVTLENVSRRDVTFSASVVAPFTLSPAGPFALSPGQTVQIAVTVQSASSITLNHELVLSVDHDGPVWSFEETVPLIGQVGEPPSLAVTSVSTVGFDPGTKRIDVGFMAMKPTTLAAAPSFQVTVTNTGGSTARNVSLAVPGPGGQTELIACHDGSEASVCVQSAAGTAPAPLGDLPPGSSLTMTWRVLPYATGAFDYGAFRLLADGADPVDLRIAGEVIPFTLPDQREFLLGSQFSQLTEKFGESTDPLADDPLAELRVTGFDARTAFSVGEVDTVDLRTGNLTLVVPIGGEQRVRGPLSYALTAVYNSSLWYRKTLAQYESQEGEPAPRPAPITALWPDASFNLIGGWSFHLGRLLPPRVLSGANPFLCTSADPLAFESFVDTGERWVYLDPAGTRHELYARPHGPEFDRAQEDPPDYQNLDVSYTRDGSFLRMDREGANVRWIDEPSGLRRRFQRRGTGSPVLTTTTLPDAWLLTRIEDRYGNGVDIVYNEPGPGGEATWRIRDAEGTQSAAWREVVVTFTDWQGRRSDQPMVVDQVALPGFAGGADRVYDFVYMGAGTPSSLVLDRENRSPFHELARIHCEAQGRSLDTRVKVPRLDRIVQPDGTAWKFVYDTTYISINNDLRLDKVMLPTGGTIDYDYNSAWDSAPSCTSGLQPRDRLGVSERRVFDVDGTTVLERTRYLRQLERTGDVPTNVCAAHAQPGNQTGGIEPYSQQTVGVWTHFAEPSGDLTSPATEHSTLAVHHFNIWPYSAECPSNPVCPRGDLCCSGGEMKSGRTHIERNTMTDPDQVNGGLLLSTESYDCTLGLDHAVGSSLPNGTGTLAGDRIDSLTGNSSCTRKRQTWADYEVTVNDHCSGEEAGVHCLVDSRLKTDKTVYLDDGGKWVKTERSKYDGLGHYRQQVTTTSSWVPVTVPTRTTFKNFNPSAGTLKLDADHQVVEDITLPPIWILDTYSDHWVMEGNVYRGGEACFDPQLGHLEYTRTWSCDSTSNGTCAAAGAGPLTDVRSTTDLVVRHLVNGQGELTRERHYGASTFKAGESIPTGDDWCNDSHWGGPTATSTEAQAEGQWAADHQDYTTRYEYDHGFLERKYVVGDATREIDREVDHATGWTATETLDSGEVRSFLYDPMGRVEWITSGTTAGRHLDYTAPGTEGWTVTESFYPKTVTPTETPPAPVRSTTVTFDGLGRPIEEKLPTYTGGTVTRTFTYHPGGQLRSISSLDDTTKKRKLELDFEGRLIRRKDYDGVSQLAMHYAGIRRANTITCVDTGTNPLKTGICTNTDLGKAESMVDRDPFGRVRRTQSAAGTVTTFSYDPLGNRTSASRTDSTGGPQITQTRTWTYDGRGFLRTENIPERDVKTEFSNFNTRGQPRTVDEKQKGTGTQRRQLTHEYDKAGRLLSTEVGGNTVKSFTYFTSGSGKGQLDTATRYNYRSPATSGVPDGNGGFQNGAWEVESSFTYDTAGRLGSRSTDVRWVPTGGTPSPSTTFTQGWGYDDFGNVTSISYPDTPYCDPCPAARTVVPSYSQGFFLTAVDDDAGSPSSTLGASSLTYHDSGLPHEIVHDQGGTDVYGIAGGMPRIASIELASTTALPRDLGSLSYDWAGNIRTMGADAFDYDLDSRLIGATVAGNPFVYGYDDFDNFLSTVNKGTINRTKNRLQGGVVYDVFGNMTSAGSGIFTLDYDELDKVAQIELPDGKIRRNVYDHDDLRVLTEIDDGGPTDHWTLRDGGRVLRDFTGRRPHIALEREYVYAGDRLLASKSFGVVETHHPDQVGSPRLITTSSGARNVVDYGPFDEVITDSGIPAGGFQGHEDDDPNTTYMRGRQFYRGGGRFLQVDPGRDGAAWSQYAYVGNNPISRTDPTGLVGRGDILAPTGDPAALAEAEARLKKEDPSTYKKLQILKAATATPGVLLLATLGGAFSTAYFAVPATTAQGTAFSLTSAGAVGGALGVNNVEDVPMGAVEGGYIGALTSFAPMTMSSNALNHLRVVVAALAGHAFTSRNSRSGNGSDDGGADTAGDVSDLSIDLPTEQKRMILKAIAEEKEAKARLKEGLQEALENRARHEPPQ